MGLKPFGSLLVPAAFAALAILPGAMAAQPAPPPADAQTSTPPRSGSLSNETRDDLIQRRAWQQQLVSGMDVKSLEASIDAAMAQAIKADEIPGGVVMVMRLNEKQMARPGIVFQKAYGNRSTAPDAEPTTLDTIYDLASLTKPVATGTSIMKLVEQGKIRVSDKVSKYIPEWENSEEEKANKSSGDLPTDRESITIRHLLTHTSGLPSFERYYERYPEGDARKQIVSDIAKVKLRGPVGGQFIYSDLGFIVLGDIVERVSGVPLDEFAQKNVFEPLGMTDTGFNPPADRLARVAPTEWRVDKADDGTTKATMIRGKVHDGNAFVQNGVSGHAGLFGTAHDLALFCKMMLLDVQANTRNVLSPITIATMTSNQARMKDDGPKRGLSWDISSPYIGQRGDLFQSGYGHTGFTGTSIWVVPDEKLAIIVLTNRVHPDGKGDAGPIRARIANIVAGNIVESYNKKSE